MGIYTCSTGCYMSCHFDLCKNIMKLPLEKRTPGAIKSLQMSQAVQFMETNEPEVFKAFSKPALSRICGTLKCGMKTYYCLPNAGVSSTHAAASLTTCPKPFFLASRFR